MTMGIYSITNTVNGKVYIGSSVNIEKRWKHHLYCLRRGKDSPIKSDWKIYDESSFRWEIIATCDPENIIALEQHYIDTLHPEYNRAATAYSGMVLKRLRGENIARKETGIKETYKSQKFINALRKMIKNL